MDLKCTDFLKEWTIDNKTGKSHYMHKRLRSAHLSIKRNMPYLWTWYENIVIEIPNTNNGLEGQFSDLKIKLRNHNGLKHSFCLLLRIFYWTTIIFICQLVTDFCQY